MVSSASGDEIRKGRDLTVWDRLSCEVWKALPPATLGVGDLWRHAEKAPLTGEALQALLCDHLSLAEIDALPSPLRARLPEWPVGTMFESADYPGRNWTLRGYGLVTGEDWVCDLPCALMEPRGGRSEYVPIEALHGDAWTARGAGVIREQIEPLSPADDVRTAPAGGMRAPMPVDIGDDGGPFLIVGGLYRCKACGIANEAIGENTWNHPGDTEACLHVGKSLGRAYVTSAHERDGLEMAIGALAYAIDPVQPGEVLSELRLFAAAILLRAREADPVPAARPMPESREAQLEAALRDVLAVAPLDYGCDDAQWARDRAWRLIPYRPGGGDVLRVRAARLRDEAAQAIDEAAERDRAVAS